MKECAICAHEQYLEVDDCGGFNGLVKWACQIEHRLQFSRCK